MKDQTIGRFWLWVIFVFVLIAAILAGSMCAGTPKRRIVYPGEATEEQVEKALREAQELLEQAGRRADEIEAILRNLECTYLPERCDDTDSGQGQGR